MNTAHRSKWNAALGAWVACAEITRSAGKTLAAVAVLSAVMAPSAWAVVCTADANGSYLVGWTAAPLPTNCNEVPASSPSPKVMPAAASWYLLARSALSAANDYVTIGATDISYTGANGFTVLSNQYLTHGSLNFTDIKATLSNSGTGGGNNGLNTHSLVAINGGNFSLTSNANYTGTNLSGTVGSYGILAGSSVVSGEAAAANNGLFSPITLTGTTTINQTTSGGILPILNAGLRAIQGAYSNPPGIPGGNGSSGKIELLGKLDLTLTGRRVEGVYVSGAATSTASVEAVSQVILNDATITVKPAAGTLADSSAIKVGKSRAVGTGKGLVVSNGPLTITMDAAFGGAQPYMSPALKMAVSGSRLLANGPASSSTITASRSALAVGIDDWGTNADANDIQALFAKATVTTQSLTAPLLLVDGGQTNVQILFDRGSSLTAAANGYLMDIINYRNAATASSAQLTLDNGTAATGLTNKSYANASLNVALDHAATWNLREKTNGDKTATFTQLTMKAGSVLNAFKGGTGAFVANGPVSSDASTIQLVDSLPGDLLTIQPSYAGSNGAALTVDTCLAGSGAASDVLKVLGDTSGTTVLKVTPHANPACPGANTATTGDGKGILVVEVSGNSNAVFSLDGGSIAQGNFIYSLVKDGKNWYLRSLAATGQVVVSKTVNASPAYSGTIPFSLDCTNPVSATTGSIAVSNNQGQAAPITVAAGSACTVTETLPAAPVGMQWAAPVYTQPATVALGQTSTASIVNTLSAIPSSSGQVVVSKTVNANPAYSGTIAFTLTCTNPVSSSAGSIAVANNQGQAAPIAVPAGSACTVSETLPAAPAGMQWAAPVYTQPATVVAGQTSTATIVNTLGDAPPIAPVPVDSTWALGGLAALLGLSSGWRRRRQHSARR